MITIGIDPGAKYTGVSVRQDNHVLLSSTYVKPDDKPQIAWAVELAEKIKQEVVSLFPDAPIGIEGISDPKGFQGGKRAPINPKHIIKAAIVLGALANKFPHAVIVKSGKNGSQDWYPEELIGRRPSELKGSAVGAGTRDHERSAFDIAGEVEGYINNNYVLDELI